MVGKFHFLAALSGLLLLPVAGRSQVATPAPTAVAEPAVTAKTPESSRSPVADKMREQLEKLPPEQRERIAKNFKQLKDLSPEQKQSLRFSMEQRKARMKKAVDDSVAASGLQLTDEQRAQFTKVYMRKRHELEERLRKEMDQRRETMLPALNKEVLQEYQSQSVKKEPAANATPEVKSSPAPAATP